MAQALHDANNHVSMVALNADLTVSLSTMMLNTLRLFEAAGPAARGARGHSTGASRPPPGGTHEKGGAAAESEPVDVAHLENVRKIVTDTCALAEPLFDKETPLVLYNALPPDEMCFLARDTFACCLFALVYRAGTRVVRGSCRLTTERADEEKEKERAAHDERNAPSIAGGALAGSPLAPRAGVRVSMEYLAAATDGAREREDGSSGSSGPGPAPSEFADERDERDKRIARVRTHDGVRDDAKRLGTAEMQFWRRRLRRLGGSLSVRRESGPGVGIATERIAMWVPTAGSDTLCEETQTRAKSSSKSEKKRRVSLDVVSLVPTTGFATPSTSGPTTNAKRNGVDDTVHDDEKLSNQRGVSVVSFEADQPADDRFGSARPSSGALEEKDGGSRRIPDFETETDFETRGACGESRVDRAPRDARPSAGSSFHDSLYDSYLSTGSADFSILYVEDERVQAYFFVNKCRRVFGDRCRVCHETDGVAALERLNRGEQFTVVVSDIFMTGMDGISFFHALFDANLNAGAQAAQAHRANVAKAGAGTRDPNVFRHPSPAPPRLNIVLTGADVDPSRGAEDAELALDLNDLQDTYGVLCYNKTSAVDVVVDVIKPHVAFVERALARARGLGEGFGVFGTETDGGPRGSDDERADWIPAPPVTRGTIPETDPFDQTETEPFDSGRLDVDSTMSTDDANRLGESGAAANLVARSGASYGAARGRPFPDVSGLRDERTRNECVSGT
jgi:CheY-like chemotaxis protein